MQDDVCRGQAQPYRTASSGNGHLGSPPHNFLLPLGSNRNHELPHGHPQEDRRACGHSPCCSGLRLDETPNPNSLVIPVQGLAREKSSRMRAQFLRRVQFFATPRTVVPPGPSVHGIAQARILEWVVIPFSKGSSQPGLNSGLLHGRQILSCLNHQGSVNKNLISDYVNEQIYEEKEIIKLF